jgi:hypothetical protein
MIQNIVDFHFFERCKRNHYVKGAKRSPNYWMALFRNRIIEYAYKTQGNFKIIVHDTTDASSFYSIPYSEFQPMLLSKYLACSGGERWIFTIRDGDLCLNGTPLRKDVSKYFQNLEGLIE